MDSEKKIIGRCPFCGGNVVKTCKGYRCENNTGEHPAYSGGYPFSISGDIRSVPS